MADPIKAPITYPVIAGGKIVAGGSVVFGAANVKPDPENPATLKAIWLDNALTQQAQNPQGLDSNGVFDQSSNGLLYGEVADTYSVVVFDSNGSELSYIPVYDLSDANAAITAQEAATEAQTAEAGAISARNLVESLYSDFLIRYFGAYASDPATNDEGNPPEEGSLYWNSTTKVFRVYNQGSWVAAKDLAVVVPTILPRLTGDGATTDYNLGFSSADTDSFLVYVDGVYQKPVDNFTVDFNTGVLSFIAAPPDGSNIDITYFDPSTIANLNNSLVTATGTTTPRTLADWTSKETLTYNTIADAKADTKLDIGQSVKTLGYHSEGDGGGSEYIVVAGGTGVDDGSHYHDMTNGNQLSLVTDDFFNIKQGGALGDGTDATDAIQAVKDRNKVAYYPDGDYPDTRNGEFYLYAGNSARGRMAMDRLAFGGTIDPIIGDPRPVKLIEKILEGNKGDGDFGNFDAGCLMTHTNKKDGDVFVCGATHYARDDGGQGGDVIAAHHRAKGTHSDAEIFGTWSYADIDVTGGGLMTEAIGHEINLRNQGDTPPMWVGAIPSGIPQGIYRGLNVLTADASNACSIGIDVGAQNSTGSEGWLTGLRLRHDGIVPSADYTPVDVATGTTAQLYVQGATVGDVVANAYGGIEFNLGHFTYGLDLGAGATYNNGKAINIASGDGYFVDNKQVVSDRQPAIPDSGDPTVDAILSALRAHGLIET